MRALFLFVCVARGACLSAPVVGLPVGSPKGSTAPLRFIGATAPLRLALVVRRAGDTAGLIAPVSSAVELVTALEGEWRRRQ